MTDPSFEELLEQTGNLTRPQIEVGSDLHVASPTYELLAASVALRLRPITAGLDRSLLGRFPQPTTVAYLLPTDLAANDRLAEVTAATVLAEPAEAESSSLEVASGYGIAAGSRLHLRAEAAWEEVVVAQVAGETLELTAPLGQGFAADDAVEAVVSYDVLGVLDEAAASHHLKVALKRREV